MKTIMNLHNITDEQPKRVELNFGAKFQFVNVGEGDRSSITPSKAEFCLGEVVCDCKRGYIATEIGMNLADTNVEIKIDDVVVDGLDNYDTLRRVISSNQRNPAFHDKIKTGFVWGIDPLNDVGSPAFANVSKDPVHLKVSTYSNDSGELGWKVVYEGTLCPPKCDVRNTNVIQNPMVNYKTGEWKVIINNKTYIYDATLSGSSTNGPLSEILDFVSLTATDEELMFTSAELDIEIVNKTDKCAHLEIVNTELNFHTKVEIGYLGILYD